MFIVAASAAVLLPSAIFAQRAGTIYRLGYLGQRPGSDEGSNTGNQFEALLRNLRDLGYVEGSNLKVESRFAEHSEDLPKLADELVRLKPDVIAVSSAGIATVVLEHTQTIPVVALSAGELEHAVKSLAKPGGNLTGMQLHSPQVIGKRLQLLNEVVPDLQRVAVLRGTPFEGAGFALYHDANEVAAKELGIRARYLQFDKPDELDGLFRGMVRERDQALVVWSNPHLNAYRAKIADLCVRYRLPAIYDVRVTNSSNELLIYSAKLDVVQREAASYVDKILKGARPGDLPIGQARVFVLIINLKAAKALGLKIPQSLLVRADEVIQ